MLSIQQCREIMGISDSIPDEKVEVLRDHLYTIALLVLEAVEQNETGETP